MRTSFSLSAILATSLFTACNGATGTPTGPSPILAAGPMVTNTVVAQSLPSLTGRWRVSGNMAFRNLTTGNALNFGTCSGSFTVTSQDGQRFTGPLDTQGFGANSDRFCTASGTFSGEVDGDGSAARARLDGNFQNWPRPAVSPACEVISAGDGVWTGNATNDAIHLQVKDRLRCAASVDGGSASMPTADFERTVSLTFER